MKLAIFWADILHYHVARLRALYALADELGHTVNAYALSSRSLELPLAGYQGLLGGRITVLSDDVVSAGPYSALSKRQLLEQLVKSQPDAVAIIGYTGRVSHAALGWCRHHRRGAVLMLEGQAKDSLRVWWKEWIKSQMVGCFDSVFAGGVAHVEYARRLGMPAERIFSGYDVVDNKYWAEWARRVRSEPTFWRKHYGLPEHFFLTAGRFIPKKNLLRLIRAYARYAESTAAAAWPLVIVGDGELATSLKQQVAQLGLTNQVLFPGYLAADGMGPVYGLASAFILASAYFEQWGLVVNEAMAAGLPVLVSNVCGCAPDLVVEGVTGFQFDPHDELKLGLLLTRVSSAELDLRAMGQRSQEHIQSYSPEVFAENLLRAASAAIAHAKERQWRFWLPPLFWY